MTDEQKLTHLIKVLKQYAEQPTCYNLNPEFSPVFNGNYDDAFEDGCEYGEITFARTLLESIEVDYDYPWSDGGK